MEKDSRHFRDGFEEPPDISVHPLIAASFSHQQIAFQVNTATRLEQNRWLSCERLLAEATESLSLGAVMAAEAFLVIIEDRGLRVNFTLPSADILPPKAIAATAWIAINPDFVTVSLEARRPASGEKSRFRQCSGVWFS